MKKFMQILIIAALLLSIRAASAFVKDPIYDDLEGYELITALINDGKLDLAWGELKLPKNKSNNPARYHLLLGRYHAAKNEWDKAIDAFEKAQKNPGTKNEADLQSARAHFQIKKYGTCQSLYGKQDVEPFMLESDWISKAQCEFKNKSSSASWATLTRARQKYASFAIEREWVELQMALQMKHMALTTALDWLHGKSVMPSQFMNLAEIFNAQGNVEEALMVLEAGRAQQPMNVDINLTLSQIYFQKGLMRASAEGFARAAEKDSKYHYHAAELQRQLGNMELSRYQNIFIADPKEKLKQKIAAFVDAGNFPMIASLENIIQRSELSKDDEIRYALAYSLVREGQIDQPLQYLSQITKPELIEKTTVLRKTLLDCQQKKNDCRL